jgi:alpha-tubulin suppressor-like RCC1 family protein
MTVSVSDERVAPLVFSTVSAGSGHTCALTIAGAAYCWGKLGYDHSSETPIVSVVPVPVGGGFTFTRLSAGVGETCALEVSGVAYCWDGFHRQQPSAVSGGINFTSISTTGEHTCGLAASGSAFCWGAGFYGALGADTAITLCWRDWPEWCDDPLRVVSGTPFSSVSAGSRFSCGIKTDGNAYCWGENRWGQLGVGLSSGPRICEGDIDWLLDVPRVSCSLLPVRVTGGIAFREVHTYERSACGLVADGRAYCWGMNWQGELGTGTTTGPETCSQTLTDGSIEAAACSTGPAPVAGGLQFVRLASGRSHHTCGLTAAGAAYCWGPNEYGALGDGTLESRPRPALVSAGLRFTSISTASSQTCAIAQEGTLYCWGTGYLGDGLPWRTSALPVKVARQP